MIYLLLGNDDYTKHQFISSLAKRAGNDLLWYDAATMPAISELIAGDLFSKPAITVLSEALSKLDLENFLDLGSRSANVIILVEPKLDKRKKETKELLKDARLTVQEFSLPEGRELEQWIDAEAAVLGITLDDKLKQQFLHRIIGEVSTNTFGSEPTYSLWQLHNELAKLASWSREGEVTAEAIEALVTENQDIQVWDIINAIADKQHKQIFELLNKFFTMSDGTDEKTKVIQLNALLAEQLRSIALVQAAQAAGVPDADVLTRSGWKSGRLFMVKKTAGKFSPRIVLSSLSKLASLDLELKSTSTPPQVLLNLIIAQMI